MPNQLRSPSKCQIWANIQQNQGLGAAQNPPEQGGGEVGQPWLGHARGSATPPCCQLGPLSYGGLALMRGGQCGRGSRDISPPKPTIHHYIRGWGGSLPHTHHLELHLTLPPPYSLV